MCYLYHIVYIYYIIYIIYIYIIWYKYMFVLSPSMQSFQLWFAILPRAPKVLMLKLMGSLPKKSESHHVLLNRMHMSSVIILCIVDICRCIYKYKIMCIYACIYIYMYMYAICSSNSTPKLLPFLDIPRHCHVLAASPKHYVHCTDRLFPPWQHTHKVRLELKYNDTDSLLHNPP